MIADDVERAARAYWGENYNELPPDYQKDTLKGARDSLIAYHRSRTPTPEQVEAVARAYDPMGWAWYDRAEADHPTKPIFLDNAFTRARAALTASEAYLVAELEKLG